MRGRPPAPFSNRLCRRHWGINKPWLCVGTFEGMYGCPRPRSKDMGQGKIGVVGVAASMPLIPASQASIGARSGARLVLVDAASQRKIPV